jgi:hypothetical protein
MAHHTLMELGIPSFILVRPVEQVFYDGALDRSCDFRHNTHLANHKLQQGAAGGLPRKNIVSTSNIHVYRVMAIESLLDRDVLVQFAARIISC